MELHAEFEPGPASELIFTVRGAKITYDATTQELLVNEHRAPAPLRHGRQRLTLFCDRTGLEVFASDDLTHVPMPFIPSPDDLSLGVVVKGDPVSLTALQIHELKSAWTPHSTRSETHPNWNQFRGPSGAGVARVFKPPIKIAPPDAAWTTHVPPGHSSPVLHGSRIFLTGIEANLLVTLALDATPAQ